MLDTSNLVISILIATVVLVSFFLWLGHYKQKAADNKLYAQCIAEFELGYIGCEATEVLGIGLNTNDGVSASTKKDWLRILTQRATVSAIQKYPNVDPAFITVSLVDLKVSD